MKKLTGFTIAFVLLAALCFALTGNLSGRWAGNVKLPDSSIFELKYTLKADSGKVTGTALTPAGEVAVTDGMINGTDFSFNVPVPNGNAPHTGKLYGDSIKMHIVYYGKHLSATLLRIKVAY